MSIVKKIKDLCAKKKMTIAELERRLDFGNSTIRKWDDRSPSSERLSIVADYFNVSTDYLLGRETTPKEDSYDEDFFAIERAAKKLDPVDRQKLRKIMELTFEKAFSEDDDIDDDDYL
ncbi:helix-turn-helix domain-containing protein [Bacillus albus]|uniref:helix-turn-helix domain-containing protein n=1 Tax=Bacillus albus TaxID=2026189 RepID=UPI00101FD320|nr:helix-turn-helix transcriptional regulator [Bacillus albus]